MLSNSMGKINGKLVDNICQVWYNFYDILFIEDDEDGKGYFNR